MPEESYKFVMDVEGQKAIDQLSKSLETLAKAAAKLKTSLPQNQAKKAATVVPTGAAKEYEKAAQGAKKLESGAKKAAAQTKKAADQAKNLHLSWVSVQRIIAGSLISRAIGAVQRAFTEGTKAAAEFEVAVSEVQTISQKSQLGFEEWVQGIRRLSDEFARTPTDVTEGVYQTLSNQVAHGAETFGVMNQAMRLSLITVSSTEAAIQSLTAAINAYGMSTGDSKHIADAFFKTVEYGRLRLSEIANTIGRVLVVGSQLGISFEEVLATLDALSIQGIRASEAQTWLRNVMLKLLRPTEGMKKALEGMGTETGSLAIRTYTFVGVMKNLIKEAERTGDVVEGLGEQFGRIRAIAGAIGIQSGFSKMEEALEEIKNGSVEAAEALKRVQETAGYKMQREFQKIKNFFVLDIGRVGLFALNQVNEKLISLTNVVKLFSSALGAVGILTFATAITNVTYGLTAAGSAAIAATAKFNILGVTISTAGGSIAAAFTAGAAAIGALAYKTAKDWSIAFSKTGELAGDFRQKMTFELSEWAQAINEKVAEYVRAYVALLKGAEQAILQQIAGIRIELNKMLDLKEGKDALEDFMDGLTESAGDAETQIKRLQKRLPQLRKDFQDVLAEFKEKGALPTGADEVFSKYKTALSDLKRLTTDVDKHNDKTTQNMKRGWDDVSRSARQASGWTMGPGPDTQPFGGSRPMTLQQRRAMSGMRGRFGGSTSFTPTPPPQKYDATGASRRGIAAAQKEAKEAAKQIAKELELIDKKLGDFSLSGARAVQTVTKELEEQVRVIDELNQSLDLNKKAWETANIESVSSMGDVIAQLDENITKLKTQSDLLERGLGAGGIAGKVYDKDTYAEINRLKDYIALLDEAKLKVTEIKDTEYISKAQISQLKEIRALLADQEKGLTGKELEQTEALTERLNEAIAIATGRELLQQNVWALTSSIKQIEEATRGLKEQFEADLKGAAGSIEGMRQAAENIRSPLSNIVTISAEVKSGVELNFQAAAAAIRKVKEEAVKALDEVYGKHAALKAAAQTNATGGYIAKFVGGSIPPKRFDTGRSVGSDTINALLAPGEFVVDKRASRLNLPSLIAMNSKAIRFDSGGQAVNNNFGDINITVQGGDKSETTVRRIGESLRREIRRNTIRLN